MTLDLPNRDLRPPSPPLYFGKESWKVDLDKYLRPEYDLRRKSVIELEIERARLKTKRIVPDGASRLPGCSICSASKSIIHQTKLSIYHTHSSSLYERTKIDLDHWGQFVCPTCKYTHYTMTGDKLAVLVTSSALHQWRSPEHPGDEYHLDHISIPGATISDLHHAVSVEYKKASKGVDLLVVSGLNDVARGEDPEVIRQSLMKFKADVESWSSENSIGFATMYVPPRLFNFRSKIFTLNNIIMELNESGLKGDMTKKAPRYHTWGLRKGVNQQPHLFETRGGPVLNKKNGYNFKEFREPSANKMLHMADGVRERMGRSVIRYFMTIHGLVDAPPQTPQVAAQPQRVTSSIPASHLSQLDPPATQPEPEPSQEQQQDHTQEDEDRETWGLGRALADEIEEWLRDVEGPKTKKEARRFR